MKVKVKVKSFSRVRLIDLMDFSLPGSSVHGIVQASNGDGYLLELTGWTQGSQAS